MASTGPGGCLPLDGSVVKMKGLPFKASSEDVISFFTSFTLRPENIFLKRHPDGRPNGEAFIVFDAPEEARRATQKDRETFGDKFGDRYVRVYPTLDSDVSDMQAAVVQQNSSIHQGIHANLHLDSVVKMKSLPFDATQLDIIQFFEGFKLKPNGVQLVVRSDNKPTGEAFVDFESHEDAASAIREKDHKVFNEKFGDRYVRLIQVSRKEMQATLALRFGGEGILKVKGIPFKASAADVRKFFGAYKIKSDGISFIMHADGRPTGMAFIEFETPQEAVRAMEKDRAKFGPEYGDRFCMLQLVGRHEMEKLTLQRENEGGSKSKMVNGVNGVNGMNILQAAALATQAALNPMLVNNQWLQGLHGVNLGLGNQANAAAMANHLAQIPQATSSAAPPLLDPSLAAQFNQLGVQGKHSSDQLFTGINNMNLNPDQSGLSTLGLLQQHHNHQHLANGGQVPHHQLAADAQRSWLPEMDNGSMLYYQGGNEGAWGGPRLSMDSLRNEHAMSVSGPLANLSQSPPLELPKQHQGLGLAGRATVGPQIAAEQYLQQYGSTGLQGSRSTRSSLDNSMMANGIALLPSGSLSLAASSDGTLEAPTMFVSEPA